jgi:hypothetical protein
MPYLQAAISGPEIRLVLRQRLFNRLLVTAQGLRHGLYRHRAIHRSQYRLNPRL